MSPVEGLLPSDTPAVAMDVATTSFSISARRESLSGEARTRSAGIPSGYGIELVRHVLNSLLL